MALNKPFSIGMIRNPNIEVSKRMEMEVIPHEDKTFHYKFTKGHDKLNCIFGEYKTQQFSNIREFGETIQKECLPNDVFVSGLAGFDSVPVLVPSEIQKLEISGDLPKEYIQRTKSNFNWSNTPGVLAVDIDEQKDGKYITKEDAIAILEELFPKAPILIKGSTSSHVYYSGSIEVRDKLNEVIRVEGRTDRQDLTQKRGLRAYIVISSLSFLHKAKDYLGIKLWNMGTGFLSFDANGKDNFKCLVDLAMYSSTDRADFIKASLTKNIDGFKQDFGKFTYLNENSPPFDVSKLKDITAEERAECEKRKKSEQENPENRKLKASIQSAKIKLMVKNEEERIGKPLNDAQIVRVKSSFKKLVENKELDELHPLFILENGNGVGGNGVIKVITTNDIFKNDESVKYYHGKSCASVLDPYYTPGKTYGNIVGGLDSVNEIIAKDGIGIDFTKAKILSLNNPPSIMDQAHGGTRFFFDTEFFDIRNLEIERRDRSPTIFPTWNFTDISNCFINQWNKDNINDVDNFGNVLLNLYKDESSVGVSGGSMAKLDELCYEVFKISIGKSELDSKAIWNKLTGYGPDLYDFMNNNKDQKIDVVLENNKVLIAVNKIDVSMRYDIVNRGFYKAKGNRLDSIIAEKIHNKDFGWVYKLGTPGSVSDFQKEDVYYTEKDDKTIMKPIINMWLSSRYKTRYSGGMEFLPVSGLVATKNCKMESSGKYIFNLYTGLNIVPKPSKRMHIEYEQDKDYYDIENESGNNIEKWRRQVSGCYLIDWHIMNVLCVGDEEKYEYMLNWIANMFQHPYRSGETLLAFQGEEGIGKNQVWDMIIRAFGSFATILTDPSSLTGNFNSGVAEKILVVLNEAFWEGDKKGHSILKGFVTDEFVMSKKKHVDDILVKNTSHLVIMTNHEAVAPMGIGDRRIVTFDVSNRYARNREYFGKLIDEMKSGGAECFVYNMLKRDISEFNISKIPNSVHSDSAISSIMNTAEPWLRWYYECLLDDEIKGLDTGGALGGMVIGKWESGMDNSFDGICEVNSGRIPIKVLFDSYLKWKEDCGGRRNNLTSNMFTRNMKRLLVKYKKRSEPSKDESELLKEVHKKVRFDKSSTVNCLLLGNLDEARESLIAYINKVIMWDEISIEDMEDLNE